MSLFAALRQWLDVDQLVRRQVGAAKPVYYLVRVNRQPVASDQQLLHGERISITPSKIEGA